MPIQRATGAQCEQVDAEGRQPAEPVKCSASGADGEHGQAEDDVATMARCHGG